LLDYRGGIMFEDILEGWEELVDHPEESANPFYDEYLNELYGDDWDTGLDWNTDVDTKDTIWNT
jgi:hypothetical protein